MSSPTQRSLKFCRDRDWAAGIVERWNPHAKIRQDLFGCIDLVVLDDHQGVLGIQATTTNLTPRRRKIEGRPEARLWLKRGNRLELWSWRKTKVKRGGKAFRWSLRRIAAELAPGGIYWEEVSDD